MEFQFGRNDFVFDAEVVVHIQMRILEGHLRWQGIVLQSSGRLLHEES